MKLKTTKKNIVMLAGLLVLSESAWQKINAAHVQQSDKVAQLCPITDTEEVIIGGFTQEIPPHDKRSFNNIIDEVLYLISNNYTYFVNELGKKKIGNPESCLQSFSAMLAGLKTKTKVNDILSELNRHKPTFNLIVPNVMTELFKVPLRTLRILRERHKRN